MLVDNIQQLFSDGEEEKKVTDELVSFIDNSSKPDEGKSFYSQIGNNHFKFQTRNSQDSIFECDYFLYESQEVQPELYYLVSRNLVVFGKFVGFEKHVKKFKKTLKKVGVSESQLFCRCNLRCYVS